MRMSKHLMAALVVAVLVPAGAALAGTQEQMDACVGECSAQWKACFSKCQPTDNPCMTACDTASDRCSEVCVDAAQKEIEEKIPLGRSDPE